ncbi:hypothetical protein VP01_3181g1 [Puccinia sorghi]|uniref:Uncharacterized protein n=1 Tax=Puccinia sorghi TaxID=27349 RepID=A0A0L6UYL9_9BASI|nr:hypothetical protein VP01_3181g1 [Puccinia sorghi]
MCARCLHFGSVKPCGRAIQDWLIWFQDDNKALFNPWYHPSIVFQFDYEDEIINEDGSSWILIPRCCVSVPLESIHTYLFYLEYPCRILIHTSFFTYNLRIFPDCLSKKNPTQSLTSLSVALSKPLLGLKVHKYVDILLDIFKTANQVLHVNCTVQLLVCYLVRVPLQRGSGVGVSEKALPRVKSRRLHCSLFGIDRGATRARAVGARLSTRDSPYLHPHLAPSSCFSDVHLITTEPRSLAGIDLPDRNPLSPLIYLNLSSRTQDRNPHGTRKSRITCLVPNTRSMYFFNNKWADGLMWLPLMLLYMINLRQVCEALRSAYTTGGYKLMPSHYILVGLLHIYPVRLGSPATPGVRRSHALWLCRFGTASTEPRDASRGSPQAKIFIVMCRLIHAHTSKIQEIQHISYTYYVSYKKGLSLI